ncbi:unnamed protein product [Closterium sp. NIES-54]
MDRHELREQRMYSRRERSPSRRRRASERGRSPTRSPRRAAYRADWVTPTGRHHDDDGPDPRVRSEPWRRPARSDPWNLPEGQHGGRARQYDGDIDMQSLDSASEADEEEYHEEASEAERELRRGAEENEYATGAQGGMQHGEIGEDGESLTARGGENPKSQDGEDSPTARGGGRQGDAEKDDEEPSRRGGTRKHEAEGKAEEHSPVRRRENDAPQGSAKGAECRSKANREGEGGRNAHVGVFRSPEPGLRYERRRRMAAGEGQGAECEDREEEEDYEDRRQRSPRGRERRQDAERRDKERSQRSPNGSRTEERGWRQGEPERRHQERAPAWKSERRDSAERRKEDHKDERRRSPSPTGPRRPRPYGEGFGGARAAREGLERVLYGTSMGSREEKGRQRGAVKSARGESGSWDTGRWAATAQPRVEVPVRFTGNEGTGPSLKNYFMQISNVKYRCNWSGMDPIEFFLSLPNTLGGEAETLYHMKIGEWLRRAEEDGEDPTVLFLDRLRKQFPGHTAQRIREFQEFRRRDEESLLTYYGQLMNLAEDVVCTDSSMIISKFLNGLDKGLAGGLRMRVYELGAEATPKEVFELAERVELAQRK